jgi:hypothetical protein
MKINSKKLVLVLLLVSISCIYPQVDLSKTAQSTMNFLLVGTSPKAAGLGEAYTSLGTGSEGIFYNPSGLAVMEKQFDIVVNYTKWIADINYLSGGLAFNINEYGVLGLHLVTVDYGVINGTSLLSDNFDPLGYIDNGPLGNVGAYVIGLSYAKSISRQFSIGGNIKLAGQNLGSNVFSDGRQKDNDATKLAFDAGVRYNTLYKGFVFGMSVRNFSSNIKREEIDEQLPLIFSMGASINVMEIFNFDPGSSFLFAVDFLHQNNYSERVNLGAEYKFLDMIALRGGFQTNRDLASWSGGVGLSQTLFDYDLEVNYSYSRFEIFDSVSRLSLLVSF